MLRALLTFCAGREPHRCSLPPRGAVRHLLGWISCPIGTMSMRLSRMRRTMSLAWRRRLRRRWQSSQQREGIGRFASLLLPCPHLWRWRLPPFWMQRRCMAVVGAAPLQMGFTMVFLVWPCSCSISWRRRRLVGKKAGRRCSYSGTVRSCSVMQQRSGRRALHLRILAAAW